LGLENKINLKDSLKSISEEKLPTNLYSSILKYEKNETAKNLLGKAIHEHLGVFFNYEYSEYMNHVDEWELNRYLLNI